MTGAGAFFAQPAKNLKQLFTTYGPNHVLPLAEEVTCCVHSVGFKREKNKSRKDTRWKRLLLKGTVAGL